MGRSNTLLIQLILFFVTLNLVAGHENRPNVILILVDDLGFGDLSIQGAKDLQTPSIDKIFTEGITFTNFYANSPVCSPSRASLLTGRYPDLVGVPGVIRTGPNSSWGYLSPDAILLPELLKEAGYESAIIGKWHLGVEEENEPNARGFEYFKGFLGDMMDDYWNHLRSGENFMRFNNEVIEPEGHATDLFTDWAIQYIQEIGSSERPFFLYLSYNAPHSPIQPPKEWVKTVERRNGNLTAKRTQLVAFIEHLDNGVGKVISALENNDKLNNTLVIFTSDNGGSLKYEANNGGLRGGKQAMYEGGIRVPTAFMWRGKIEKGTTTSNIGMLMDIFPTICDLAGITISHEHDGISLLPSLLGDFQVTNERPIIWVRREGYNYGGHSYHALRYKNLKILQNSAYEPLQMFDLEKDELESNPLPTDNKIFERLKNQLTDHIHKSGSVPWQKPEVKLDSGS